MPHPLFPDLELISVPRRSIQGLDLDIQQFLVQHGIPSGVSLNAHAYDPALIRTFCAINPPVLIRRGKQQYTIVGSGQRIAWIDQIYDPDEDVPALLLAGPRIPIIVKLQVLACELVLPPAMHRTRRGTAARLFDLSTALEAAGTRILNSGRGDQTGAFAGATGFSRDAIAGRRS
ncbi:MAG TPA: hypothetical protein PLN31_03350 [Azoarcus taiwanensis]|nr:hypothetical protein [Azoarcus taiwanensis]